MAGAYSLCPQLVNTSSRKRRRGGRPAARTETVSMYDNNLNGFNGKKASIVQLLEVVKPTIANFQETAVSGNNQMKANNYICFQRNRKGVKTMGGVATLVSKDVKSQALRVAEGEENDEFLVIRLGHVEPAVNVINVYEGIENRRTKQEVTENWVRIKKGGEGCRSGVDW